jgi:hypothetical protein
LGDISLGSCGGGWSRSAADGTGSNQSTTASITHQHDPNNTFQSRNQRAKVQVRHRAATDTIFSFSQHVIDLDVYAPHSNLGGYGFHDNSSYPTPQSATFEKWLFDKVPETVYETPIPPQSLQTFDKIFASQWIDPQTVVTGSKDNKVCAEARKRQNIVADANFHLFPLFTS